MKKLIAIGLVIIMVLSIIVIGVSLAKEGAGAAKSILWLSFDKDDCDGAVVKEEAYGFVILNTDASGKLIATFALKGATANVEYELWVFQVNENCERLLPYGEGSLTTNNQGNGNGSLQMEVIDGAVRFWATAVYRGATRPDDEKLRSEAVVLD